MLDLLGGSICDEREHSLPEEYSRSLEGFPVSKVYHVRWYDLPHLWLVDLMGGSTCDDVKRSPPEEEVGSQEGVPVSKAIPWVSL